MPNTKTRKQSAQRTSNAVAVVVLGSAAVATYYVGVSKYLNMRNEILRAKYDAIIAASLVARLYKEHPDLVDEAAKNMDTELVEVMKHITDLATK